MPLYSYRCPQCGRQEDRALRLSESDDPQFCPSCSLYEPAPQQMEKLATSAALAFKGDGWTPKHY